MEPTGDYTERVPVVGDKRTAAIIRVQVQTSVGASSLLVGFHFLFRGLGGGGVVK